MFRMTNNERDLLYPCLSDMEKDTEIITMVEQDMIRLAGGCILSIAICSVLLLVPLLPCSKFENNEVLCLRLVLFLHGKRRSSSWCLLLITKLSLPLTHQMYFFQQHWLCHL